MSGSSRTGVTRRNLLLAVLGAPALAQQRVGPPPHEHGPKVFLDYDQAELDAAYDQASYAPNAAQITQRDQRNSELARARLGEPMRFAYGPSAIEQIDVFVGKRPLAGRPVPIHIHIHGGAWRGGSARNSAYLAEPFVEAGGAFVIPDFAHVQDVKSDLNVPAAQVQRAIEWTYKNIANHFAADPNRLFLSGHSSGAHLAACALTSDWGSVGVPSGVIKGAVLVSGMYDLKGPRLSSRSEYVKFNDATEEALSPQRHLDKIKAPLVVAYASLDTPEFQRQSREFAATLKAAGKPVELITGEGYNHFEFIETMANPYGILGHAAVTQMMGLRR